MNYHEMDKRAVLEALAANAETGLTSAEAETRLLRYGENRLDEKKHKGILMRFFAQFNDFLIIILLFAAGVSAVVSKLEGHLDLADPLIILGIVTLNAVLGLAQEAKAEKSLEALKNMTAPTVRALRNGVQARMDTVHLVPGDIIFLEAGDLVPADARLIQSFSLKAEESALTGESEPVEKDADGICEGTGAAGRKNSVFAGSGISAGRAAAVVTGTGMNTEVGRIAAMLIKEESPETPLQKRLDAVGKALGIGALIICGVIFALGILRDIAPFEMFMVSVSLAVAAIPEGLPAIVTIVLALGVQRMAKRGAIVRKLPAVETLGQATVICSDKTGTLTKNKMTVTEVSGGFSVLTSNAPDYRGILKTAAICADCVRGEGKDFSGDPTEIALVIAAEALGLDMDRLNAGHPRAGEIPFDSERKLMTVIVKDGGAFLAAVKGAPDVLLKKCTEYMRDGEVFPLDGAAREKILAQNNLMAGNALRVIGVAQRKFGALPANLSPLETERDLVFMGLIGMIDPPRDEARQAVALCREAGIKPVMITGDHVITGVAIAKRLGIMEPGDRAVTGAELDNISPEELAESIGEYAVFARVSPEHKMRIVRAFQAGGEVAAMTGDGVNDAPALKAADIGCAMGITGTDAAKGAADMVLTDDNFATIVHAVREGRGIYDNIVKSIHFLLSSNVGEILTIFAAMLLGWPTPLLAIHLLWVNLVTDSLPAIALGLEPADADIMRRKPLSRSKGFFAGGLWARIAFEGCMIGALALTAFAVGKVWFDVPGGSVTGQTMAFATLSISQLVHAFNMKSRGSIFSTRLLANKWLIGALLAGLALQVSVIMIGPVAAIFKVAALGPAEWLIVAGLCLMPIAVVELEKLVSGG